MNELISALRKQLLRADDVGILAVFTHIVEQYGCRHEITATAVETLKNADRVSPMNMFILAQCYQIGCGVERDWGTAIKHYLRTMNKGLGEARYAIGMMIWEAFASSEDVAEAAWWLEGGEQSLRFAGKLNTLRAAPASQITALDKHVVYQQQGFWIHQQFLCSLAPSKVAEKHSYATSNARSGGVTSLRLNLEFGGGYKVKAPVGDNLAFLDALCTLGSNGAKYRLARIYEKGGKHNGARVKPDLCKAFHLMQSSAKKGHYASSYHLSRYYRDGIGCTPNAFSAAYWYKKSKTCL